MACGPANMSSDFTRRETAPAHGDFLVADAVLKNQSAEAEFC